MEIRSRHHVHSALAARLAAVDDFACAGDAARLARSRFLSTGARRSLGKTFFYLEVSHNEDEC